MQEQRWDFQANASGGRRMPVEGGSAPCLSQQLVTQENGNLWKGRSVISDCKKACICVTMESGVRTYGCML
jgi:hypothetical protein